MQALAVAKRLAALADLPQAIFASKLEVADGKAQVTARWTAAWRYCPSDCRWKRRQSAVPFRPS